MRKLKRKHILSWKNWSWEDYICYFLCEEAALDRLTGRNSIYNVIKTEEIPEFCLPIKRKVKSLFDCKKPKVSILIPAYNEEEELIPTILSLTCLDFHPGDVELIIVDNNSKDNTKSIIESCGAKYVSCLQQGLPFARNAGVAASSESAEYLWLLDADCRTIPPLRFEEEINSKSDTLNKIISFFSEHPKCIGVSTCSTFEKTHWSYSLIHKLAVLFKYTKPYSCWSGRNQFIKKSALLETGGIDLTVNWGEDHNRRYQLMRYARKNGFAMDGGDNNPALLSPVYASGRRYGTFKLVWRHFLKISLRPKLKRNNEGIPIYKKSENWESVRAK